MQAIASHSYSIKRRNFECLYPPASLLLTYNFEHLSQNYEIIKLKKNKNNDKNEDKLQEEENSNDLNEEERDLPSSSQSATSLAHGDTEITTPSEIDKKHKNKKTNRTSKTNKSKKEKTDNNFKNHQEKDTIPNNISSNPKSSKNTEIEKAIEIQATTLPNSENNPSSLSPYTSINDPLVNNSNNSNNSSNNIVVSGKALTIDDNSSHQKNNFENTTSNNSNNNNSDKLSNVNKERPNKQSQKAKEQNKSSRNTKSRKSHNNNNNNNNNNITNNSSKNNQKSKSSSTHNSNINSSSNISNCDEQDGSKKSSTAPIQLPNSSGTKNKNNLNKNNQNTNNNYNSLNNNHHHPNQNTSLLNSQNNNSNCSEENIITNNPLENGSSHTVRNLSHNNNNNNNNSTAANTTNSNMTSVASLKTTACAPSTPNGRTKKANINFNLQKNHHAISAINKIINGNNALNNDSTKNNIALKTPNSNNSPNNNKKNTNNNNTINHTTINKNNNDIETQTIEDAAQCAINNNCKVTSIPFHSTTSSLDIPHHSESPALSSPLQSSGIQPVNVNDTPSIPISIEESLLVDKTPLSDPSYVNSLVETSNLIAQSESNQIEKLEECTPLASKPFSLPSLSISLCENDEGNFVNNNEKNGDFSSLSPPSPSPPPSPSDLTDTFIDSVKYDKYGHYEYDNNSNNNSENNHEREFSSSLTTLDKPDRYYHRDHYRYYDRQSSDKFDRYGGYDRQSSKPNYEKHYNNVDKYDRINKYERKSEKQSERRDRLDDQSSDGQYERQYDKYNKYDRQDRPYKQHDNRYEKYDKYSRAPSSYSNRPPFYPPHPHSQPFLSHPMYNTTNNSNGSNSNNNNNNNINGNNGGNASGNIQSANQNNEQWSAQSTSNVIDPSTPSTSFQSSSRSPDKIHKYDQIPSVESSSDSPHRYRHSPRDQSGVYPNYSNANSYPIDYNVDYSQYYPLYPPYTQYPPQYPYQYSYLYPYPSNDEEVETMKGSYYNHHHHHHNNNGYRYNNNNNYDNNYKSKKYKNNNYNNYNTQSENEQSTDKIEQSPEDKPISNNTHLKHKYNHSNYNNNNGYYHHHHHRNSDRNNYSDRHHYYDRSKEEKSDRYHNYHHHHHHYHNGNHHHTERDNNNNNQITSEVTEDSLNEMQFVEKDTADKKFESSSASSSTSYQSHPRKRTFAETLSQSSPSPSDIPANNQTKSDHNHNHHHNNKENNRENNNDEDDQSNTRNDDSMADFHPPSYRPYPRHSSYSAPYQSLSPHSDDHLFEYNLLGDDQSLKVEVRSDYAPIAIQYPKLSDDEIGQLIDTLSDHHFLTLPHIDETNHPQYIEFRRRAKRFYNANNNNNNGHSSNGYSLSKYQRAYYFHQSNDYSVQFPIALSKSLEEEILHFYRWISPTIAEQKYRDDIISLISSVVKTIFPLSDIYVYGSVATNLCLPTSDIDFVVILKEAHVDPLTVLANQMLAHNVCDESEIKLIYSASVPIIKLVDPKSKFRIDISFGNLSYLRNLDTMRSFLEKYQMARPVILLLKYILHQHNLNITYQGGLGSYTLLVLVVHFIMTHNNVRNLSELFLRFLQFYGLSFNYQKFGISCYNYGSFYLKEEKNWFCHWAPTLLSVEDPLDDSADLGKKCFNITAIKNLFKETYQTLITSITSSDPPYSLLEKIIHKQ